MNEQTLGQVRHPWLGYFVDRPSVAIAELLAGYADVNPYTRADAPEIALRLFKGLDEADPALQALGPAILTWLNERRKRALPAARAQLQSYIREVCEALEIVALLKLEAVALELRQRFVIWNDWFAKLVLSPARDARAVYWRTLALTQPGVAEYAPYQNPYSLAPIWQSICRESGGLLPRHYLSIGLLGLRRLPNNERELPWLSGLAQWALAQQPADAEFRDEWLALKSLYPRAPAHWRKAVDKLLSAPTFREVDPPGWWHIDRDFEPMTRRGRGRSIQPLRSPLPDEAWEIVRRLAVEPYQSVSSDITSLFSRHRFFVQATGDSRHIVRAMHAIGSALINNRAENNEAARAAQALAQEGLSWEPRNEYLLSLWHLALAAEGLFDAAEMVGWESIRRNPDNPQARNQLATLLAVSRGRADEAEFLLRQAIARFPNDLVSRDQLATLLADYLGRPNEAEALLRETMKLFTTEVTPRNQLATILAESLGRAEEAETLLLETMTLFPADPVSRNQLATVLAQFLHRPAEAETCLRDAIEAFPTNIILRRHLANVLEHFLGRRGEAVETMKGWVDQGNLDTAEIRVNPISVVPHAPAAVPDESGDAAVTPTDTIAGVFPYSQHPSADSPKRPSVDRDSQDHPVPDYDLERALRFGSIRRLRFLLDVAPEGKRESLLGELQAITSDDPAFWYAEVVLARYNIFRVESNILPPFAAAFELALAAEDRARLERLSVLRPRLQALTLVARALVGDREAELEIVTGLSDTHSRHAKCLREELSAALRPVLHLIEGGRSIALALEEGREAVTLALYDANESTLGDAILAA